jgi:vitamin B12 transporter
MLSGKKANDSIGLHVRCNPLFCFLYFFVGNLHTMQKQLHILQILVLLPFGLMANVDSVRKMQQIIVHGNMQQLKEIGTSIHQLDSLNQQLYSFEQLQQVVGNHSHIYMRNYGSNNLSTVTVRGSNSSQVSTLWNGFNLNMLSQNLLDYNLIPSFLMDKVGVQYGANCTNNSSGAIGASVLLNSHLPFGSQSFLMIGGKAASFNQYATHAQLFNSNAKFVNSTKVVLTNAVNNFTYFQNGNPFFPKKEMQNNAFMQAAILQENKILLRKNHILQTGIWLQQTDKQLPASITSSVSMESQYDAHARFFVQLNSDYKHYNHEAKVAFSKEILNYHNPGIQLHTSFMTNRVIAESNHQLQLKQFRFLANVQYNFAQMISKEYNQLPQQHRIGFQLGCNRMFVQQKLNAIVQLRKELISGSAAPIIYSAALDYQISPQLQLQANVHRVFRLPSFNDLFWSGVGNPNLQSEKGWAQEIGFNYLHHPNPKKNKPLFTFGAHVFNRKVDNWIVWTPSGNVWRPYNVLTVWSRGLELKTNMIYAIKQYRISIECLYTNVLSTNQIVNAAMSNALGKQLIYTPQHNASVNIALQYKTWSCNYNHQFVGKRFTSTDNENVLPYYTIANAQLQKKFVVHHQSFHLSAGANNLFNQNYQVIAFRPMPLRNYFLSFNLRLQQNQHK